MHRSVVRFLLPLAALAAFPASASGAPGDARSAGAWTRISGPLPAQHRGAGVETRPKAFRAFGLERAVLATALKDAPRENTRAARAAQAIVSIPAPDGTLERFRAVESPVMEPELAARHPEIKTYAGRGIDDPSATVRFDLTPLGFHASVRSERGSWYVDPYYKRDQSTYVSYLGRDLGDVHGPFIKREPVSADGPQITADGRRAPGDFVVQRIYRLAFLTDPSYASYFGGAANVASANATLINRVNQIYNDDVAVKMQLIGNNDLLNLDTEAEFSGPTGPCAPGGCFGPSSATVCDPVTLNQNQAAIDRIVGTANYDIGHIGLGRPGGGIAGLGVVGRAGQKARGCTGVPTPKGDLYAVDYVAHEMGHQFDGDHTFNGTNGSCTGNENASTAVEPGSGSSVMAYAGICAADDIQPHSDPYFSQVSTRQIQAYITASIPGAQNGGFSTVTNLNRSPVVTPPAAKTIPVRTPFTLSGSATDPDSDPLIFTWEQNDPGTPKPLLDNAKPDGPLFRVFGTYANVTPAASLTTPSPGENIATAGDSTRTFPDMAQIAAGNTNAVSGQCPAASTSPTVPQIDCFSEFLPTSPRTLNFRLTARDRSAAGGGVSAGDTTITIPPTSAVPFQVTSQAAPATVGGSANLPVTWNVAGTNASPFNVADVKISYSVDGGLTFPTVLATSTPNDGSENIDVPSGNTTAGRFKVEAVGNYFFDISDANLTVSGTATSTPTPTPTPTPSPTVTPAVTPTPIATSTGTAIPSATPVIPTPTPSVSITPAPTVFQAQGVLRPDLSETARRLRADRRGRVALRLRCLVIGTFNLPSGCSGRVTLSAKLGGRRTTIGSRRFSFPRTATKTVKVRLSARARGALRRRGLKASAKMTVGPTTATKRLTIRRRP